MYCVVKVKCWILNKFLRLQTARSSECREKSHGRLIKCYLDGQGVAVTILQRHEASHKGVPRAVAAVAGQHQQCSLHSPASSGLHQSHALQFLTYITYSGVLRHRLIRGMQCSVLFKGKSRPVFTNIGRSVPRV